MSKSAHEGSVVDLAARLQSLSIEDQIQVLRLALGPVPQAAADDQFRAALNRVLQEDREILEGLKD